MMSSVVESTYDNNVLLYPMKDDHIDADYTIHDHFDVHFPRFMIISMFVVLIHDYVNVCYRVS